MHATRRARDAGQATTTRLRNLAHDPPHLQLGPPVGGVDPPPEVLAAQLRHHGDGARVREVADAEELHHVIVPQPRQRLRLHRRLGEPVLFVGVVIFYLSCRW